MAWKFSEMVGAALHLRRSQLGRSLADVAAKANVSKWSVKRWEAEVRLMEHRTEIQLGYGYFNDRIVGTPLIDDAYDECCHGVLTIESLAEGFRRSAGAKTTVKIALASQGLHGAVLEPVLMTLEPNSATGALPEGHSGEEVMYVVKGEIVIEHEVAGMKGTFGETVLKPGSIAHLHSEVPHRLLNRTSALSECLLVKFPPDRYSKCTLRTACDARKTNARTLKGSRPIHRRPKRRQKKR